MWKLAVLLFLLGSAGGVTLPPPGETGLTRR